MSEQTHDVQAGRNRQARRSAMEAVSRLSSEPTGLVQYHSRGRVLVIGEMDALEMAPRLRGDLTPQVLLTDGVEEPGVPVVHQGGRLLRIEGHLGDFRIHLGEAGKPNAETLRADLILDLSPAPLLQQALTPPGYLHASSDEASIQAAIDTLYGLVGTFEKPTYFKYDPSICAHGRSGHIACNRCVEACPAQAITGLAESIEVNPNLCQGGGICATVCPSGAIQYAYPSARDTLERIRILLQSYREQGGDEPVLLLVSEADGEIADLPRDNFLPVVLEELASAGLEVWLSALAYGARRVLLVDGGSLLPQVREPLEAQLQTAHEILRAMDYPAEAISLVARDSLEAATEVAMPILKPAGFHALKEKRQGLFMAIDHLHEQAARSKPVATLSTGAPFGTAQVDEKACTLCMACVSACPGKALQHGQGEPQLRFIEANCLQCGMCTRTCPEDAIWITPRLLLDRDARSRPRILCEEEPFDCTVCGKPFATRSVINNMLTRLQGHWMYQNERSRKRLTMCEDCRVVDAMQDEEVIENSLNGPIRQ